MSKPYIWASREITEKPVPRILEMHTHDFYEMFIFLAGDANYHVEGTVYLLEPGDILIMKKAEAHSMWVNRTIPYERTNIGFNADAIVGEKQPLLKAFLDDRPFGQYNRYPAALFPDTAWKKYFEKIVAHKKDPVSMQLYLTVLLNELHEAQPLVQQTWQQHENQVTGIINYINNNYTQPLTIDHLCKEFYISSTQLNRIFRNSTGVPVWKYITTKRLLYAKELIENGEMPAVACAKSGFNDYSPFYRAYKARFGASPKEHRK